MKKMIALLLGAVITLSFAGCETTKNQATATATATATPAPTPTAAPTVTAAPASTGVGVSDDGTNVSITIPASLASMRGGETELSEEDKTAGFTSMKVNADGSLTYIIPKDKYQAFITEYRTNTASTLDSMVSEGTYTFLKDIQYNDDFSQVTVVVTDKASYDAGMGALIMLSVGMTAMTYQIYAATTGKSVVTVKDTKNTVIATETYPDALTKQ